MHYHNLDHNIILQAALVIHGFAIRGFDYPRIPNSYLNLLSAAFPSGIRGFLTKIVSKSMEYCQHSAPLWSAVLLFAGYLWEPNPRE